MWEVFARFFWNDRLLTTHFLTNSRCMPQTTSVSVQGSPSIPPPWIWQKKGRLKPDRNCLLSWMIRKSSMFRWGLFLETDYYLYGLFEGNFDFVHIPTYAWIRTKPTKIGNIFRSQMQLLLFPLLFSIFQLSQKFVCRFEQK